ncbi:MAG TPA: type IV secretion system protein [Alphaproteobacteria bacterium]|nr:type IV secretion system protein [Alphaproteobacteria bacterium]
MITEKDFKHYLEESRRIDQDRLMMLEKSKKTAWIIAGCSFAIASLSVLSVLALTPLKTVEPYLVRVDSSTGYVDTITNLSGDASYTQDEALMRHFLKRYVTAREGYTDELAENNFNLVSLYSVPEEQNRFANWYYTSNPQSPQNIYRGQFVDIRIRSISFIATDGDRIVAQIRFDKVILDRQLTSSSPWVSNITFYYDTAAFLQDKYRLDNPLGFQVLNYSISRELGQ